MNIRQTIIGAAFAAYALGSFAAEEDFVRWVDPLVGTVNEGNTFPGTCYPFGQVQASPDSGTRVWCPGYKHTDTTIRGFSQTHLNGTGRPAMGDVSLMPFCGETNGVDFGSPFKKENQSCAPDCYSVFLDRYGIKAEATSSQRVGWWRFTYPKGVKKQLLVDAAAMLMQGHNIKYGARILDSSYEISKDRTEIRGGKQGRGWTLYRHFYSIKFDRAPTNVRRLPPDAFDGKGDRFIVDFDGDDTVLVQVGVSGVSAAGAAANRLAETKGQTFESVRTANRAAWNEIFARARLVKGTDDQKKNWYTSLYHLCIQPNDQTDIDGKYRAANDTVKTAKGGYYSTFSLWDTFRAAHPFYTILTPERVDDFSRTLLEMGKDHGHLPMWTMYAHDSHCMIGIHSIPVIVDAWAKGFRGFDAEEALTLMVQSMINNDGENPVNCWNAYWENGYFPYKPGTFDQHLRLGGSVSRTLEFAYNWWCIAHFAELIGNERTRREAQRWADCWKNVFDEKVGFARPRAPKNPDGGVWREPFDPRISRVPGEFWSDYTEANSWIYTWHVFQDPFGLAKLMGGEEKTVAKLDAFFSTPPVKNRPSANNDEGGASEDGRIKDGQVGQYWHGNEPSHHIIYFYTLMNAPRKAQKLVHAVCRDAYKPTPEGLCGNDDCGQMSAWYLFSMLGFYPFNPCDDGYVFGAPQAEEMVLALPGGKELVVRARNLSEKNIYVKSIALNGKPVTTPRLTHGQLLAGGELVFEMGE